MELSLLAALRSIFGIYQPIQYVDYSTASDGSIMSVNVVPAGLAGVNMEYVASVLLFAVVLVCVFKLLGVVLKAIVS